MDNENPSQGTAQTPYQGQATPGNQCCQNQQVPVNQTCQVPGDQAYQAQNSQPYQAPAADQVFAGSQGSYFTGNQGCQNQDPYFAGSYGSQGQAYQGSQPYQAEVVSYTPTYLMSDSDRTLRLVAFVFMCISLATSCWLIIPLAWMIPMTVMGWGIYKGTRPNTVAFGVCTLIFVSLVAGILLLISKKDR